MGNCFGRGTATFLIMGDVCSRSCRFCGVKNGIPSDLDPEEPARLADAAAALALSHVVITSVTRDDLPDGGAAHYAATMRAIRSRSPKATLEVLVPDFGGNGESLDSVLDEGPEVFDHNMETVARLYDSVRPQADYRRSLSLLRHAASRGGSAVKTGFMLGLGEGPGEVEALLKELADTGVDMVTIGQYLQPGRENLPVIEYVHPDVFADMESLGESLGLLVRAGPFVRSSFRAAEGLDEVRKRRRKSFGVELQ